MKFKDLFKVLNKHQGTFQTTELNVFRNASFKVLTLNADKPEILKAWIDDYAENEVVSIFPNGRGSLTVYLKQKPYFFNSTVIL